MKTLKSMLGSVALLFIFVAANATTKPVADKQTRDDVVKTYIDAVTNGKADALDKILGDDMQFNTQRGENVNTLSRDQFVDYVKNTPADASATTTTTVEQDDETTAVVKVDFKYAGYTRTDEITLTNANGWTISKVTSSLK